MTEERHRLIDAVVKVVTVCALLVGVPMGYFNYIDTQRQGFHVEEWNRRLEFYIELSREMAGIASAVSYDEAKKYISSFERAYYGPVCLLMDEEVMEAMEPFAAKVIQIKIRPDTFNHKLQGALADDIDKATDALRDHLYKTRTFKETTKRKGQHDGAANPPTPAGSADR